MANPKRLKREVVIVTIANGSAFGNVAEPAQAYKPDVTYKNIIGVWAKVLNLANQAYVNLQLRDGGGGIVIDPSHSELWAGGPGNKPEDMFVKVNIPISGAIVKPGAIAPGPANPNADIVVQFVFLLSDELVEVNN